MVTQNPRVEKDLELLKELDVSVVEEFCKIAAASCRRPGTVSDKVFSNAASKLGAEPKAVERAVDALVFLAMESARRRQQPDTAAACVVPAALFGDEAAARAVAEFCASLAAELRGAMLAGGREVASAVPVAPRFRRLHWRLQIPIASRSNLSAVSSLDPVIGPPTVILRLVLSSGDGEEGSLLEASPRDLVRVLSKLEEALREVRSWRTRKVLRALK